MRGHKLLYGASGLMVLGFCIHLVIDWHKYNTTLNSAPFWVWICADALLWLIPAALAALAGLIAYKKFKEKTK
mgnify:CR=1 FL=1